MPITDLNADDRIFIRLGPDPVPSPPIPCEYAAKAILDGLQDKAKIASAIPFVWEVPFEERKPEFVAQSDDTSAFRAWLAEQSAIQTKWGSIQIKPYGTGYWVHIGELTQAVVTQAITRLLDDAARIDEFAINEAFRRHCPEPLRCVDVRDAVNQLRNKGQIITHIIASDGVEVPDDLNLIVHRFPVADGFVLTGGESVPILLTREEGFDFMSNLGRNSDRASFAIERKVGVSVIGPLELCRIVPAA